LERILRSGKSLDRPAGRMTNDEKKAIITRYLDASVVRDFAGMREVLTEDFQLWMILSAAELGLPNPMRGREAFLQFVSGLSERPGGWKTREYTAHQFLYDGDSVAVRLRMLGDFPSGFVYDNEYVFIFKLAGDKICEMREFTDLAYIESLRRRAAAHAQAGN
jgi:ketosteroid isomerase-like protein